MTPRHRRPTRNTRRGLALAGLVLLMAPAAVPAFAHDGFVEEVTPASPESLRMAPGSTTYREVRVTNESPGEAELHLQARDVLSDDNGCVHPEVHAGDTSCDDDGGELGDWLVLGVRRVVDGGSDELWAGTLEELEEGVDLADAMPGNDQWTLRLVSHMPFEAGNETQTDTVTYALRWTLSGEAGPVDDEVLGVEQAAGGGDAPADDSTAGGPQVLGTSLLRTLPSAGADASLLLLLTGAGLASTGALILAMRRRRSVS